MYDTRRKHSYTCTCTMRGIHKTMHIHVQYQAYIMMGESNTVVSAYTLYRHLQQYYSHPSIKEHLCFTRRVTVSSL